MANPKTIGTVLNKSELKQLSSTMKKALSICDYVSDDRSRLTQDIHQQFKVNSLLEIKSIDLPDVETWILTVWPQLDLKRRLMRQSREVCEMLLQVDKQMNLHSVQFG